MNSKNIIQYFIDKYHYKDYLELGIYHGSTFPQIKCENKDGVDIKQYPECPFPVTYICSTDDFFSNHIKKKYDIIFIDALHEELQVDKDLVNSIKWLKDNGTIVLHDCYNPEGWLQWGIEQSAWKTISKFNCTNSKYSCHVVNTDCGCGIVRRGYQEKFKLSLEDSVKWENAKLNLISEEEFKKLY